MGKKSSSDVLDLMKALATLSPKQLELVVKHLDAKSHKLLADIFHNISYNTVGLSSKHLRPLKRKILSKKEVIRDLINPVTPASSRRNILRTQMGGGLISTAVVTLLPLLISALT